MTTVYSLLLFVLISVNCKRFTREPKCGDTKHFRFDEELPTYDLDLSYCQYYRGETCCNRTHTNKIIKHVYAYHEQNVSTECRNVGLNVGCSPCDPRVGTNQLKGICVSYCDKWYNACKDDYFHYNKRGLLTACSEGDIVCSKLSSIINNGTQLCELSGYDISHTAITCYNGIKSTFKPPPSGKEWESPFTKLVNSLGSYFNSPTFQRNLKVILDNYDTMPVWQKLLVIAGFAYSILALFKFGGNILSHLFGSKETTSSKIPDGTFGKPDNEEIREKRLKFLAKQRMISKQMNMEAKLAEQLGLNDNENEDDTNDGNEEFQDLMAGNNQNGKDTNDEDVSLSDDGDIDEDD